jgi:hypothetical protein
MDGLLCWSRTTHSTSRIVLSTDGAQYFQEHPQCDDGLYKTPLIGVIVLDPVTVVVIVGTDVEEK